MLINRAPHASLDDQCIFDWRNRVLHIPAPTGTPLAGLAETNDRKCLEWRTFPVAHIGIKNKFGGLANQQLRSEERSKSHKENLEAFIDRLTDALGIVSVR